MAIQLNTSSFTDFDGQLMQDALNLMHFLQSKCLRENLKPDRSVLHLFTEELEGQAENKEIPTLSSMKLTFDDFIEFLVSNKIYEAQLVNDHMWPVSADHVSLAHPKVIKFWKDKRSEVIWLAPIEQGEPMVDLTEFGVDGSKFPRYDGVGLADLVPRQLNISQSALHELVEFLYRSVGHSVSASRVLCERPYHIPSAVFLPLSSSSKYVDVQRVDFERCRVSSVPSEHGVLQALLVDSSSIKKSASYALTHVLEGKKSGTYSLPCEFPNAVAIGKWMREHKQAPNFLKNLTLGEMLTIVNWLRVKQVLRCTRFFTRTVKLHNPTFDFPIVRHFVSSCASHEPQWRCGMFQFKANGDIFFCDDIPGDSKEAAENNAYNELTCVKAETKKIRESYSVSTLPKELLNIARLDVLLFMQRQAPIVYVESKDGKKFKYKHAHTDYPLCDKSYAGTTSLKAQARVAKMILQVIDAM